VYRNHASTAQSAEAARVMYLRFMVDVISLQPVTLQRRSEQTSALAASYWWLCRVLDCQGYRGRNLQCKDGSRDPPGAAAYFMH